MTASYHHVATVIRSMPEKWPLAGPSVLAVAGASWAEPLVVLVAAVILVHVIFIEWRHMKQIEEIKAAVVPSRAREKSIDDALAAGRANREADHRAVSDVRVEAARLKAQLETIQIEFKEHAAHCPVPGVRR